MSMAMTGTITNTPTLVTHYVEWEIPEFTSLSEETGDFIFSPSFSFIGETWCLKLYPNGCKEAAGYISLYLRRKSSGLIVDVDFSMGYKTLKGEEESPFYLQYSFPNDPISCGCHRSILRSDILERRSELLPSNTLTVFCLLKLWKCKIPSNVALPKCSLCKEVVNDQGSSLHETCLNKPIKCAECSDIIALKNWCNHDCKKAKDQLCAVASVTEIHENKILLDLKEWFLKKEDCDVIIKVKEQEFPAHRSILQARSTVFASTFRNEMKEKATGIVEIDDCDPSSFSDFLCFVYCGSVNISVENVFSLYTTADKYDVQDLTVKCMVFMKENLSVDTFCDTMTLALRHSEKELIKSATDYFIKNAPKIVVTAKWQTFLHENTTYGNELIIKLLAAETSMSK